MSDSSPETPDFRSSQPFHDRLNRALAPGLQSLRLSGGRCALLAPQRP
jgi:hypothetical protein